MTAAVEGAVIGRPSAAQLTLHLEQARVRIQDLSEELTAVVDERASLASEISALSRRIDLAIRADRADVAMHVAGRLDALGASLTRRGAA